MHPAAIGARVHSGWAALVAVTGERDTLEVIDRRRIVITDPKMEGAVQPYHAVEGLDLPAAEKHLTKCMAESSRLASSAIGEMSEELRTREYRIAGCAILLASGRPLPELAGILASHAMIHVAEGEFYREIVGRACEEQGISVTGIRERDLEERVRAQFGGAATSVQKRIAGLGKSLGPPWTQDQKSAALAAAVVLATSVDILTPRSHHVR